MDCLAHLSSANNEKHAAASFLYSNHKQIFSASRWHDIRLPVGDMMLMIFNFFNIVVNHALLTTRNEASTNSGG